MKIILGLLWCLILHYQIAVVSSGRHSTTRKASPREVLLTWFRSVLPQANITNFTTDWNDGLNLSALVEYCKPGLIPDLPFLSPYNQLSNISHAMNLAEEHFNIPQIISPYDLAMELPDERCVMTYLSFFCRPGSIGQRCLLNWIQKIIPGERVANLSTDLKDGRALCAIVNVQSPGSLPPREILETRSSLERTTAAMQVAKKLGVQLLLSPEDLINPSRDQLTTSAYLAQFRNVKPGSQSPPQHNVVADQSPVSDEPKINDAAISNTITADLDEINNLLMAFDKESAPAADPVNEVPHSVEEKYVQVIESVAPERYLMDTKLDSDLSREITVRGRGIVKGQLGVSAEFVIDCSCVERGQLEVEVVAPSGEGIEVACKESTEEEEAYQVQFSPTETGTHSIEVNWNGEPISGSPFQCQVSNPRACIVTGTGLYSAVLGEKATFSIATHGAGPGSLSATVYGPAQPVELSLVRSGEGGDGLYTYEYTPQQPGTYVIEVKWDGHAIPNSPFKVTPLVGLPTAPTGKICVTKKPTGRVSVYHSINITVNTSTAGSGMLHAIASGPSVTREVCKVAKVDKSTYTVVFRPPKVGKYRIEINYNYAPIPDSPLNFTVNDPSKCQVDRQTITHGIYHVNCPATFTVSTHLAGEGNLTGIVRGPKNDVQCDISKEKEGKHSVTFVPLDVGRHAIKLLYDNQPVPNTPLSITVGEIEEVDIGAEFTVPNTEEDSPLTGRLLEVQMQAPDTNYTGFNVTVIGVKSGATPSMVGMIPTGKDTYNINFRASIPDNYKVDVLYNGKRVKGSPLIIAVYSSPSPSEVMVFDPVIPLHIGKPIELFLDTSQAGLGELSAKIISDSGERLEATIAEVSSDLYSVSFLPNKSGVFKAHVKWAGQAIGNTPITVHFKEKTREPTVSIDFHTGHSRSIITVLAYGAKSGQVDVVVRQYERGKYEISFNGSKDTYKLHVRNFNREFKHSPFTIDLLGPPEMPKHPYIAATTIKRSGSRGVLSACVVGKTVGAIPIKLQPSTDGKRVYMSFSDSMRDLYDLYIFWNRQLLKGAPFTINTTA